ncbi:hypothetical protein VFPPC_04653 [Pochonia chlamydosporia 170]|uniref:Uncharacterized protein n=1 Tax=Pochonia chlamydosporia 170 TaxID=1380566 RepID=A0A179FT32_METCM|nr:hypothetical protein VFPPC_04653 [Pochonia chlamydosporia 170]OAQ68418.1 hypothetical protein VFPPC_04653 [Pochonia chlamydosporia 170]
MAPSFEITPQAFRSPTDHDELRVSFTTSTTGRDPLFPATYLQVSYRFGSGQEIFGEIFTPRDIMRDVSGNGVYHIAVPFKDVPIAMVNREEDLDAEVSLHAWKDLKYLNSWVVGEIKDWGMMR